MHRGRPKCRDNPYEYPDIEYAKDISPQFFRACVEWEEKRFGIRQDVQDINRRNQKVVFQHWDFYKG